MRQSTCRRGHVRNSETISGGNCRLCHSFTQQASRYKKLYGLTLDDYNKLFSDQKGCCLICKKHQSDLVKKLGVDHDHATGKIRGLLCSSCNAAIGLLEDDIALLQRAISYLNGAIK